MVPSYGVPLNKRRYVVENFVFRAEGAFPKKLQYHVTKFSKCTGTYIYNTQHSLFGRILNYCASGTEIFEIYFWNEIHLNFSKH